MMPEDVELTIVTLEFYAVDPERLIAVLSKYVVLSRQQPGCRNIDLCGWVTTPARFLIIGKWEGPGAQGARFARRGRDRMRSEPTSSRMRWSKWPKRARAC